MRLTHQQKRAIREQQKRAGIWKPALSIQEHGRVVASALAQEQGRYLEAGRLYLLRWRGYSIEATQPARWEYWLMEQGAEREDIAILPLHKS